MRKQSPKLDWQMVEDDAEWERQHARLTAEAVPAANGRLLLQRFFWRMMALLVLLVSGGSWRSEQTVLSLTATNPKAPAGPAMATVAHRNDQWEQEWWRQFRQQRAIQSTEPTVYEDVTLQTVEFVGDRAVARVTLKLYSTGPAYQQTWFYRHTPVGWLRTPLDANTWKSSVR